MSQAQQKKLKQVKLDKVQAKVTSKSVKTKAKTTSGKQVKVVLKKSLNGVSQTQKQTALCLGLKKINQERLFKDSPAFRGQVEKIQHLLSMEVL